VFLDLDGTLREATGRAPFPRSASEVRLLPRRREVLEGFVQAGYRLFGVSNQAGVALGQVDLAGVEEALVETQRQLGLPMEVVYCPHPADRPACWCRKPLPGFGVWLAERADLDLSRSWMVGDRPPDEGFAAALGVRYAHERDFFGPEGPRP
jgi:histidinol-phosphate phosphatase family protein